MKLPQADWTKRRGLKELLTALDGQARYVGGAVRDTLLGIVVKDVDMATPLLPEDVMERLTAADIKVVPTGIDHGTVTAVLPDGPVEITTLRRDVSTDGRRATVAFSEDWKEDAARRDFTINALSADPETLEIFDYFNGLTDLEARRVRFIGSAEARIAEDHLRIMRYFRFLARFGQHELDDEAFAACAKASPKLESLSRERIADELLKLLATGDPLYAIEQMIAADVFAHIAEAIDPDAVQFLATLIQREQAHGIAPSAVRRLVGLLPKDAERAEAIAKSLRLSKKLQKAVADRLAYSHRSSRAKSRDDGRGEHASRLRSTRTADGGAPTPTSIRPLAYWHGIEAARDRALLFGADKDIATMLEQLKEWQPPTFPLTGGDLIAKGMEPGPEVSETLATLEREWIEKGFPDKEEAFSMANKLVASIK